MCLTLTQYLADLRGKRVTVIGIGVSNRPLLALLARAGALVTARDKKTEDQLGDIAPQLKEWGVELVLGEQYMENIEGDVVFRTPGLRPDHPGLLAAAQKGACVTSEMEVFFDVCPCPVIAVTGSDGKTTTTSVIAEMLRADGKTVWLGGNIGTPLLDQAENMQPDHVAVLELSSFQLMSMKKTPSVAVITNLSPNHLDWHRDFEEYVEAKCNLFKNQGKEDVLVLNYDNLPSRQLAEKAPGQVRFFSRESLALPGGVWLKNGELLDNGEPIMEMGDIRIPGMHNVENYMAACAALRGIVSHEVMRQVAREFNGVEHRLELARELDGVKYYNDSIASSPSRTLAGLKCFPADKIILIAGGYDKHIPFDELGNALPAGIKTLLLCGATADKIEAAVKASPDYAEGKPAIARFDNLDDTVAYARKIARPGDLVLLSPACASFDQFPNFAARGRYFKELVHKLA
ncbi:MAG: UDP-N-acetylmuramoyl-L-alanine--D-glutamate ligase [Clostridia bacterium]|nr:UDP-N-acetylmuramoyl-L-alanine--D-glutamate ligase [Clostridia bacterium]